MATQTLQRTFDFPEVPVPVLVTIQDTKIGELVWTDVEIKAIPTDPNDPAFRSDANSFY